MRSDGNVLSAGDPNQDGLSLPMEEREDRHEVRARHEAKRGRTSSPWAGREAPAPGTKEQKAARNARSHDPAREAALFEPKPFAAVPAPTPSPAPKVSPGPNAASIVQDYVDGVSIRTIAMKRKLKIAVVRETLAATPGLVLRPEDATPPAKRDDAPELVEAVRRLYLAEGLTQQEIAARLNLTPGKVKGLMTRHAIPGRRSGPRVDPPRPELAAPDGLPSPRDLPAGPDGLPSPWDLAAHTIAHQQPDPAPAVVDVPPAAKLDLPTAPPVARLALTAPPARTLTSEQQQAAEILGRALGDCLREFADIVAGAVQQIVTALAASRTDTQDDYTLAGDPE